MSDRYELTVTANAEPGCLDPYTVNLPDGRAFVVENDDDAVRLWRYTGLAILMRMGSRAPGAIVASVVPMVMELAEHSFPTAEQLKSKLRQRLRPRLSHHWNADGVCSVCGQPSDTEQGCVS